MSSFIIFGENVLEKKNKLEEIRNKLKVSASGPDLTIVSPGEKTSIGIETIRELKRNVSLKPYKDPNRLVIIEDAKALTIEAQNALLKILEEPPERTFFVLLSDDTESLLPTIVSRCQIAYLTPEKETNLTESDVLCGEVWQELLSAKTLKEKIEIALKMGEKVAFGKEEAILFLDRQSFLLREILMKDIGLKHALPENNKLDVTEKEVVKILKSIRFYKKLLSSNVTPRLCLENLFLEVGQ